MNEVKRFEELLNELFNEYEERVVVTAGAVPVQDGDWAEEVYLARINLDGDIKGAISYDGVEDALNQAMNMVLGGEYGPVDVRHIENFKDALDELGFDRAVALLEQLEK
jgi:CheY-specific phosphatase CheX